MAPSELSLKDRVLARLERANTRSLRDSSDGVTFGGDLGCHSLHYFSCCTLALMNVYSGHLLTASQEKDELFATDTFSGS